MIPTSSFDFPPTFLMAISVLYLISFLFKKKISEYDRPFIWFLIIFNSSYLLFFLIDKKLLLVLVTIGILCGLIFRLRKLKPIKKKTKKMLF